MKVYREITSDYAAGTRLSQKMQIVVSLLFLMSERNKHKDECFSQGEKQYQQEAAEIMLSFSVEGCCTLTVKLRSSACALRGQTASEDSNGRSCLFTFLFSQKVFVFMVGLGS